MIDEEEASVEEIDTEEEPVSEALYSFPLEEPITLTAWAMWIPGILEYIESAADNFAYAQAAVNTGVTIDFDLCASDTVAATNFNLIIASGDYPDLFCAFKQYYNYGEDQAVEEEILVPFDDYMETYMPNLSALMEEYPELAEDITTANGHVCTGYVLRDPDKSFYSDGGLCIRKDWLDECGLSVPTTFDEFEEVLLTLKETYNTAETLWVNQEASVAALTQEFYGQDGHNAVGFYIDDDWTVQYQMINEDSDYGIKLMNHYYEIGLISPDFMSNTNQAPDESTVAQGGVAVFGTYISEDDVARIYAIYSDIDTYQTEVASKAITGQVTLDDALYADYEEIVQQMGLEEALEIYNKAMETYIEANGIDPTIDQ